MKVKLKAILLLAATLVLVCPVFAGVVYEIEVKESDQSARAETMAVAVEGRNLKMRIRSQDGNKDDGEMIYRGDRREVVVVDHENRTYHVINKALAEQIQGQMGGRMDDQMAIARRELQKRLGDMNEEQRRGLEQALGNPQGGAGSIFGDDPVATEVRKGNKKAQKAGYPCSLYEVWRGGEKVRELWITDWSKVEGGSDAAAAFKDMADFFDELMASGFSGAGVNEYSELFGLGGFPVVTRSFEGGELEDESALRSAKRQIIDPDAFEPPSGYKRQEMFGNK